MTLFIKYLILISKLLELKTGKTTDVTFVAAINLINFKYPQKKPHHP
jgi:hypothetical protein